MFDLSPDKIEERLTARPTRGEFTAILIVSFCFFGIVYFAATVPSFWYGYDYGNYINGALGIKTIYFLPEWLLPIFEILAWLPKEWGFLIWGIVNILGYWFAIRVFGGKIVPALLNYQLFYSLFYGQIVGITAAGLALMWWSMHRQRWHLAGVGGLVAVSKVQVGGVLGLAIWLLTPATWRDRFRMLIIPILVLIVSLVFNPDWLFELRTRLNESPPNDFGSIALWSWVGPLSLLVWIPVLSLKMPAGRRLIAVAAATALGVPYFQQTDLVHLYMFPIGYLGFLGNIGLSLSSGGWRALRLTVFVAIITYVWVLWEPTRQLIQLRRARKHTASASN